VYTLFHIVHIMFDFLFATNYLIDYCLRNSHFHLSYGLFALIYSGIIVVDLYYIDILVTLKTMSKKFTRT